MPSDLVGSCEPGAREAANRARRQNDASRTAAYESAYTRCADRGALHRDGNPAFDASPLCHHLGQCR